MTPIMVRTMPTMGANGINGQMMRRIAPRVALIIISIRPTIMRISLEIKPTHLDTKRSVKAWNFNSREALLSALPAEICR